MANGKKRLPVDLIIARGKKHLSEKEIRERRSREVSVPKMAIKAPKYLTKEQKRTFNVYAKKLSALGDVFTHLDVDVLAQYVIAFELYVGYSGQLNHIMNKAEADRDWNAIKGLTTLQDKAFKQCLACARELGLTITSRAKIEVPPPPDGEDDEL
jgi:P27 family predicted phage terminase small subunit